MKKVKRSSGQSAQPQTQGERERERERERESSWNHASSPRSFLSRNREQNGKKENGRKKSPSCVVRQRLTSSHAVDAGRDAQKRPAGAWSLLDLERHGGLRLPWPCGSSSPLSFGWWLLLLLPG
jgi:hypothetical protein